MQGSGVREAQPPSPAAADEVVQRHDDGQTNLRDEAHAEPRRGRQRLEGAEDVVPVDDEGEGVVHDEREDGKGHEGHEDDCEAPGLDEVHDAPREVVGRLESHGLVHQVLCRLLASKHARDVARDELDDARVEQRVANERVDAFASRFGLALAKLVGLNRGMPGARGGRLRGSDRLRAGTQLNMN